MSENNGEKIGDENQEIVAPVEPEDEDGAIAFNDEEDGKYQERLTELKEIAARWVREGKKGVFRAKDLARELDQEE